MTEPKILSFSAGPVIEREPPDHEHIKPHAWLSRDLKARYDKRLRKKGFFELYISKLAAEKMMNHAKSLGRIRKEALGFILGDVCSSEGRNFVIAREIVTGTLLSTSDRVKFDRDNLSRLFTELDASGFDYVIVGWYHSHPGYGCFMSRVDISTQATVFSESFHSAIVIDPRLKEIKAFRFKGKRCLPLDFAVYWHDLESPYNGFVVRRSRIVKNSRA